MGWAYWQGGRRIDKGWVYRQGGKHIDNRQMYTGATGVSGQCVGTQHDSQAYAVGGAPLAFAFISVWPHTTLYTPLCALNLACKAAFHPNAALLAYSFHEKSVVDSRLEALSSAWKSGLVRLFPPQWLWPRLRPVSIFSETQFNWTELVQTSYSQLVCGYMTGF